MNNTLPDFHRIPVILRALLVAATAGALVTFAGCDAHANATGQNDTHGHQDDDHHDHDHDHGEAHDHEIDGAEHTDEVTLSADAIARAGITIDTAQKRPLRPTIFAPALVSFNTEAMAHIGSPLRGRVIEIPVRVGDQVRRGDVVCMVESPELGEAQAELMQKRVAMESAGPAVELAKASWERARSLYEQSQGTSLAEVQRREAEYKSAVAAQRAADAAGASAESHLLLLGMDPGAIDALLASGTIAPHHAICSPIDGTIIDREITLGELVGPDRELLMVVADTSTLWIVADVPEASARGIAIGARAWIESGSSGSERYEGSVAFMAPMVDPSTRTIQVRIEAPASTMPMRPGMFARVELATGSGDQASIVAVPVGAVQTVEGAPSVFVPVDGEPNTFARRVVTIGPAVGGFVPILSGLSEGERFVATGTFILKADLGKGSAAHEH